MSTAAIVMYGPPATGEAPPQRAGHERGDEDDHAAHRRRLSLAGVGVGRALAHHLVDRHRPQPRDDAGRDEEGEQQRRDERAGGPDSDVVEEPEHADVAAELLDEQEVKHAA
jgi:hypothetical protein